MTFYSIKLDYSIKIEEFYVDILSSNVYILKLVNLIILFFAIEVK